MGVKHSISSACNKDGVDEEAGSPEALWWKVIPLISIQGVVRQSLGALHRGSVYKEVWVSGLSEKHWSLPGTNMLVFRKEQMSGTVGAVGSSPNLCYPTPHVLHLHIQQFKMIQIVFHNQRGVSRADVCICFSWVKPGFSSSGDLGNRVKYH